MSQYTIFRRIFERLSEHERRLAGTEMRGKVKQVDAAKTRVRLVIGKDDDGVDVLSPWVPYAQTAGKLKIHSAPSIGQAMSVRSETGDVEQGVAHPFHWTDDNASPSSSGDEHVLTLGRVAVKLIDDGLEITVGGTSVKITGSSFEVDSDNVPITGSSLTHNNKNVGDTHVHGGIVRGGADTDTPH